MHSYDATFKSILLKKLAELAKNKTIELSTGQWAGSRAVADVGGEYLKRVGFLRALEEVAQLMADTEREINEM